MRNRIFFTFVMAITVAAFSFSIGQSGSSVKEKLKKLKGEIEKIVITTDEGEVTLEGKDAQEAYKIIKDSYGKKSWTFTVSDDDDGENVFVIKKDSNKDIHWISSDSISIGSKIMLDDIDEISKKIEIKIEDDEKTVTVTTKEDGEEKTETYTGEEAEEYLKKLEDEDKVNVFELKDNGDDEEQIEIILKKMKKVDKDEK